MQRVPSVCARGCMWGLLSVWAHVWNTPESMDGLTLIGKVSQCMLGGGFKYFLFSPLLGEDSHFD